MRLTRDLTAGGGRSADDAERGFGVIGWGTVMRDGDYTVTHDHGESIWSSAYYVDAGDADLTLHPQSGHLAFIDPRRRGKPPGAGDLFAGLFTVRPRASLLVLFPGYLQHYVHPYRGTRPRIMVSCNLIQPARSAP